MANKTQKTQDIRQKQYEYAYKKDYASDWDIHRDYIQNFDAYEAMAMGYVWDSISKSVDTSRITDSFAMTLAKERADRVIAKLPEGVTEPMAKADEGKAAFMDILRQKWIYPNANSQHPFLVKMNMWQLYSSVYGYMPMFYDWNVSSSGYAGPDCWLWNPRNLVPQQGRTSIADMDYVTALTWVSKKYLQNIKDNAKPSDGWNREAVDFLLELADKETDNNSDNQTTVEKTRTNQSTKKGICLATRYESGKDGKWITFAPDHGCVEVRKLDNPHKNGRIPFVIKYSQPLFDSFYGLGDFQRAKSLQFARDGLTNFYFKGIKMNLIPPLVVNANGVMKHTIDYREGSVMMETIPNSIRRLETSTAGLNTYQAAQSNLTGSLLSLYGTQNASLPGAETLNPEQGKTPAAIDMFSQKEASRDGAERRMMEAAIEQLTDGFYSLIVNIGTQKIPVGLFAKEIKEIISAGLEDVVGIFEGSKSKVASFAKNETLSGGELTIDPAKLKGVEYRFNIESGTTMKINKEKQLQELERMMDNIGKQQNVIQEDPRVQINWPQILETYETLTDIKGASEFIIVQEGPTKTEMALQQQLEETQQAAQQQITQLEQQNQQLQQALEVEAQPDDGGIGAVAEEINNL